MTPLPSSNPTQPTGTGGSQQPIMTPIPSSSQQPLMPPARRQYQPPPHRQQQYPATADWVAQQSASDRYGDRALVAEPGYTPASGWASKNQGGPAPWGTSSAAVIPHQSSVPQHGYASYVQEPMSLDESIAMFEQLWHQGPQDLNFTPMGGGVGKHQLGGMGGGFGDLAGQGGIGRNFGGFSQQMGDDKYGGLEGYGAFVDPMTGKYEPREDYHQGQLQAAAEKDEHDEGGSQASQGQSQQGKSTSASARSCANDTGCVVQ